MVTDTSTEQRILSAARTVFTQKGMAGTRMQEVADAAGINKALLHYYFRNKQQLFEGVFKDGAESQFQGIWCTLEDGCDLFMAIRNFVAAYMDKMLKEPGLPMFIASEMHRDPSGLAKWIDRGSQGRNQFIATVEKAKKQKLIIDIEPQELLVNMMALCAHPFIVHPLITHIHGMNEKAFERMIEERRKSVPEFIIRSIKK